VGVCRAPDFDIYRHLLAPGGIANHWFIEAWGEATYAQDNNDVAALFAGGYWPPPKSGADNVLGVRPVDDDENGILLAAATIEHRCNFNVAGKSDKFMFVDNQPLGSHRFLFEPEYRQRIEKANVPVVIRCGWHDAGTALGALSLFTSFSSPIRVILGPWSHAGYSRADPFLQGDGTETDIIAPETVFGLTVKSLDATFKQNLLTDQDTEDQFGMIEYYTLGENRWKTAREWPLPQTKTQCLYLAADHQLRISMPTLKEGSDRYQVDPTAATGLNNRWHAQTAGKPILFPDRAENDKKLMVYDTSSLENDTEITGHPVVHLYIRSNATDGQFFVYLETVDPDGRVRMLTEGQLRGLHRKVSDDTPPYKMFGPYHSLKEKDALPLIPGEVAEIAFDLFPISVLLKKGQRIRLAIAGADADVFAPILGCESPALTVERNSVYASCIELPIIA
jgi:putative CocE/NonD family hydrolase